MRKKVKKRVLVVGGYAISLVLSCCSTLKTNIPTPLPKQTKATAFSNIPVNKSEVEQNDTMLLHIVDVDSIYFYMFSSPQDIHEDSLVSDLLCGYPSISFRKRLNSSEIAVYNFIVKEPGIFVSSYPPVKQAFLPCFGLKTYKDSDASDVIFSFGSEEMRIENGKQSKDYKMNDIGMVLRWISAIQKP